MATNIFRCNLCQRTLPLTHFYGLVQNTKKWIFGYRMLGKPYVICDACGFFVSADVKWHKTKSTQIAFVYWGNTEIAKLVEYMKTNVEQLSQMLEEAKSKGIILQLEHTNPFFVQDSELHKK